MAESGRWRDERWVEGGSHLIPSHLQDAYEGDGRREDIQNTQRLARSGHQLLRTNVNLPGSTSANLMAPLHVFSIWHSKMLHCFEQLQRMSFPMYSMYAILNKTAISLP